MTKIINTLMFLRELLLGREASRTQTKRHKVMTMIFIATIAISAVVHYYSIKYMYKTSTDIIQLKKKLEAAKKKDEYCHDIEVEKKAFEQICRQLTNQRRKPIKEDPEVKLNAIPNKDKEIKPKKNNP